MGRRAQLWGSFTSQHEQSNVEIRELKLRCVQLSSFQDVDTFHDKNNIVCVVRVKQTYQRLVRLFGYIFSDNGDLKKTRNRRAW